MSVAILIPVLNRPGRVRPLLESIEESSRFVELRPVFIVSHGDEPEKRALLEEGFDWITLDDDPGPGDYAKKINLGVVSTRDEFVFFAADDLRFYPGWIERALACHLETGACVVGTNDLGNHEVVAGRHSTHTLVHRDYMECGVIDDPDRVLCEKYAHNWVDAEFVATAQARETYWSARDSIVEHLHPLWRKAETDTTYERGQEHFETDRRLFTQRRQLWEGGA